VITILGYHEIEAPGQARLGSPFTLSHEGFESHLRLLSENGARTIRLDSLLSDVGETPQPRAPRVAITFDDGHASDHQRAFKLLERYGYSGTFFVTTSHIDSDPKWLTSAQIREMADAGMEFGSHTHTHPYLDDLASERIVDELTGSKRILEEILGHEVRVLACPGGRYDGRLAALAHSIGYRAVCTSRPGHNRQRSARSPLLLDRYIIKNDLNDAAFADVVAGRDSVAWARSAYRAKRALRRFLGNRVYHSLWNRLRVR
jgi:peptidoglycan/xylan/chitin deacetylase (PgdA/CDA1 family)